MNLLRLRRVLSIASLVLPLAAGADNARRPGKAGIASAGTLSINFFFGSGLRVPGVVY